MTDRGLLARVPGATASADGTRSRTRLASRVLTDWRTTLRTHWLFAIILGLGLALRVISWLAYQPAMMYIDSFRYVPNLFSMHMDGLVPDESFIAGCLSMVAMCDAVLALGEPTEGMRLEIAQASSLEIPVFVGFGALREWTR